MPPDLEVHIVDALSAKVQSSCTIYELLDNVYELYMQNPFGENTLRALAFIQTIFPPNIYCNTIELLQQRQRFKKIFLDYLPGDLTTHVICTEGRLASVAASLNYKRRFCIFLQISHPYDTFPAANYLPEYAVHFPQIFSRPLTAIKGPPLNLSSSYCNTKYLTKEQREIYRVFLTQDGLICRLNNINGVIKLQPVTASGEQTLLVMSPQGWLFVAEKGSGIQHTSFLAGGPVIFAGYCKLNNGMFDEIKCDSGHFSPPIGSLQNLIWFLVSHGYSLSNLEKATFLYVNRLLKKIDGQEKFLLSPDTERVPLADLLSHKALERGVYKSGQERTGVINLCPRSTALLSAFFSPSNKIHRNQCVALIREQPESSRSMHEPEAGSHVDEHSAVVEAKINYYPQLLCQQTVV